MENCQDTDYIEKLVQMASREDMVQFALDYAKKNTAFRSDLQDFLSKKYVDNSNILEGYVTMLTKAFLNEKNVGGRWRLYYVTDWESAFREAAEVIHEGEKLLELGEANTAATIAVEFFHQFCEAFDLDSYLDEENALYNGSYECKQAESLLLNSIGHPRISEEVQKRLIAQLKQMSDTSFAHELDNYGIFDFDDMLLKVNMKVVSDDEVLALLDEQIELYKCQSGEHVYVARKLDLLRQLGRIADADKTEEDYLHLSEIRQKAISRLVDSGDYAKAVAYAEEGVRLSKADDGYGTPGCWYKMLLDIYERTGNLEQQKNVCRELFLCSNGSMEYYTKLKNLIAPENWKEYLTELIDIADLSDQICFGQSNLADIYVEERDSEKLFQLVMGSSKYSADALNHYAKYVDETHTDELFAAYFRILKNEAVSNVNAKAYQRIAFAMKCMQHLKGGVAAAHELAEFFRQNYNRRTRMMEELKNF